MTMPLIRPLSSLVRSDGAVGSNILFHLMGPNPKFFRRTAPWCRKAEVWGRFR